MKSPSGAIAIAAVALLAGCNRAPPTPEKTVQQLMAEDVQPTAQIYWDSAGHVSELVDGKVVERELRPVTDADWQRTKDATIRLGELAELLKTPAYAEGRGPDWITFANSLGEIAKLAEQSADQRDTDRIFEIGGTLYNVCTACHQVYPATTGPEAEEATAAGEG